MREKFICRFQDSSNQSIVCALFVLRVLTLPPCQGSACWFNICQIFVDNQQNSRAGFQALMSYHACLSNDMSAWARRWHLPTQPTPAQTTRDLVQLLREICEVVGGSILEPVLWSSGQHQQGCISCGPCSCPELTEDHVLPSAYVEIFRTVTRNAVNKSFWRKKDCSWPPLNKYAMNIWLSSLKIRAHLSWRTGKHLHVLHVLRTYSTCSCPGQQDTTTYAALMLEL